MDRNARRRKAALRLLTPGVETTANLRSALRRAEGSLTRDQILKMSEEWSPRPTRTLLAESIGILAVDGLIVEGNKGVKWVPNDTSMLLGMLQKTRKFDRQLALSQLTEDDAVRLGRDIPRSASRRAK